MIDCFVCERKHRAYKTLCGNQVLGMNKAQFTKTALLQLAQQELNAAEEVERFHTRQLGNPKESKAFQSTFRTSQPAWLSTGLEHQAVRYVRGQFLLLGKSCAVENPRQCETPGQVLLIGGNTRGAELATNGSQYFQMESCVP